MRILTALTAALSLLAAAPVQAACQDDKISIELRPGSPVHLGRYAPFGDPLDRRINVRLTNDGSEDCAPLLLFRHTAPEAARLGGAVGYTLHDAAGGVGSNLLALDSLDGEADAAIAIGVIRPTRTRAFQAHAFVAAGQIVPSGDYYAGTDAPIVSVYDGDDPTKLLASAALDMRVRVAPQVLMNVAGAESGYRLNFQEITTDEAPRTINLIVRSNAGFRVILESDNGGRMVNQADDSWTLPYEVEFGGDRFSLDRRAVFNGYAASGTLQGETLPLTVRLGDPTNMRAGEYKDFLEITVAQTP